MTTATTLLAQPTLVQINTKLQSLEDCMNGKVYERRREIETFVIALIARKHHLQVGIPGIGKTYLVDTGVSFISGLHDEYFRTLLTRQSTPEEVFGLPSLKAMEQDLYRRNTKRMLPEAKVAFLDEIFNCNSSILNSLLTIFNEGKFFNGGLTTDVPLGSVFAGTNVLPRDAELSAFWDRITIRHEVKALKERGSKLAMLQARANRATQTIEIDPVISWDEIVAMQGFAASVSVPLVVMDALLGLWDSLAKEGILPSDRRFNDCIDIIQATAARSSRTVADVNDMRHLRHVLWMELNHQPIADRLVLELANPLDREAMSLLEMIEKLNGEVGKLINDTENQNQRRRKAIELNGKLDRCGKDLTKLDDKARKSGTRSEMIGEARTRLTAVVTILLRDVFEFEAEED